MKNFIQLGDVGTVTAPKVKNATGAGLFQIKTAGTSDRTGVRFDGVAVVAAGP